VGEFTLVKRRVIEGDVGDVEVVVAGY